MSTTTSKGIPVPENTDTFAVPADLAKVAAWVDEHPGITTVTTAVRDVLVGADVWPGRIVFNSTSGQLEQNKTGTAGSGGWSPVTPADLAAGSPSMRTLGTGATQAAAGNDPRLSNARTPTGAAGGKLAGTYPNPGLAAGAVGTPELADNGVTSAKIADGTIVHGDVAAANKDGAAGTPSMRTLGTGAQQAAAGDHKHDAADTTSGTFPLVRLPVAASGTSSATQLVRADDSRLSDQRVPTGVAGGDLAGTYPAPTIKFGTVTDAQVAAGNKDGAAGTPSMRTLGTGAQQAAAGNHGHADLAPRDSPAFTGSPTAPTPAPGDSSKSIANTEFTQTLFATLSAAGGPLYDSGPTAAVRADQGMSGTITYRQKNGYMYVHVAVNFPALNQGSLYHLVGVGGIPNPPPDAAYTYMAGDWAGGGGTVVVYPNGAMDVTAVTGTMSGARGHLVWPIG